MENKTKTGSIDNRTHVAEVKRCLHAHAIKSSDEMLDDLIQRSGYNPRR